MLKKIIIVIFIILTFLPLSGENITKPLEFIIEPPTLICLGFEWYIEGDENRNAFVEVNYRKDGEKEWKEALPLLRIGGEKAGYYEWDYVTPEMFAGSIFDLEENTTYECRFELIDPDGVKGKHIQVVHAKTRARPREGTGGRIRHVYPNTFNIQKDKYYSFDQHDQDTTIFNGLLHAYYGYRRYADWVLTTDPVQPGDIILIHAGTYKADFHDYRDYHGVTFDGTYTLTQDGTAEKPIVIKAAGDGEVIFDGNGAHNLFNLMGADYHHIEDITIRNTEYGIIAGKMNLTGCNGLVVQHCRFENIGIGIHGVYEGSRDYYIADNYFFGREDTSALYKTRGRNPMGQINQRLHSYYAVKVYGQGHVICYNQVKWFFDGIDVCTHSNPETEQEKKSVSIDIYNNDIFLCNDNFIEADGGMHNIRVMRNRAFNAAQAGWSNQPVLGGPAYWIRNIGFNTPFSSAMKWWGMDPAGVIVYHNTLATFNTRFFNGCSNVHFRNNLFIPPDDEDFYSSFSLKTYTAYSTSDYNGYRFPKTMQFPIRYTGPQRNTRYDLKLEEEPDVYHSLKELFEATGLEEHGITVDYNIFTDVPQANYKEYYRKTASYPIYYPENIDFRLVEGSKPIDAGCMLPNINDSYKGKGPDLGAIEFGTEPPHYGPRP